MRFDHPGGHGPPSEPLVSGLVLETIFKQKVPEMNELRLQLSNAYLNLKIGSVVSKLQPVKVDENRRIWIKILEI